MSRNEHMANRLVEILGLSAPPLAISFHAAQPEGVEPFGGTCPAPTDDGRTGAVPAGCVFWMHGTGRTFATRPEDHANCSVGSLTHGLIPLDVAATRADVQAVCEAGWVDAEVFPDIPTVRSGSASIVYGPLAESPCDPDVAFLRLTGKQVMQLHAAVPALRFEGKPQCHIIAIAKEAGEVAVSVGCMLSRVRTGMSSNEVTCAIPGASLEQVVSALERSSAADRKVAEYASADGKRFR